VQELGGGLAGLVEQQLNGVLRVKGGERAAQSSAARTWSAGDSSKVE
jgi:hypothetical protein